MKNIRGLRQWQTARAPITTEDTLLTDYKPADITDVVKAKMISVHPAMMIILRVLGKDTANFDAVLVISGWADPNSVKGPGPGHRLWKGRVNLGTHSFADVPLRDKKWGASATWFTPDVWSFDDAGHYDMVGVVSLDKDLSPDGAANQESTILLPTLGYSHLLLEITDMNDTGEMTECGILWRQIDFQHINHNPWPTRIVPAA